MPTERPSMGFIVAMPKFHLPTWLKMVGVERRAASRIHVNKLIRKLQAVTLSASIITMVTLFKEWIIKMNG
jgi:hypothetical protein